MISVLLTIVMTANLRHDVQTQVFENRVRDTLRAAINNTAGDYLSDVRFAPGDKGMIITAVVRGPRAPTPQEVRAPTATMPTSPDSLPADLRVRFVLTQTITAKGLLYQDQTIAEAR